MSDGERGADVDKQAWRALLKAKRRQCGAELRAAEAAALAGFVAEAELGDTVCCYLPLRTEPGDLEMANALLRRGVRVLAPVIDGAGPLNWARYTGELRTGAFGIAEPVGEPLGAAVVGEASALLIPALAIAEDGTRLGKGAGHYDRTLHRARPDCLLIGVVRDEELVAELPGEDHDVPMTHVLTPAEGIRRLSEALH